MICFACPACKSVLKSPDHTAGHKIACPKCGQRLQIPSPTVRPARNKTVLGSLLSPFSKPKPARATPAPPTPPPSGKSLVIACPGCGCQLQVPDSLVGNRAKCPKCKAEFTVNATPRATTPPAILPPVPLPVPSQPPPDPFAGIEQTERPHRGSRLRKLVFLVGFLGVLGCMGGVAWWGLKDGHRSVQPKKEIELPKLRGNEEEVVKDYLNRNLHDPSGMEIVEWGEPRLVITKENDKPPARPDEISAYVPGVIMHVRVRAKNALGAKVLQEITFLIQESKVVRAAPLPREIFGDGALNFALAGFGVAAERVGGKVTKVLVRGKITHRGKPVTECLRVSLNKDRSEIEPALRPLGGPGVKKEVGGLAVMKPPHYEIPAVPPGEYLMVLTSQRVIDNSDKMQSNDIFEGAYSPSRTPLSCVVTDKQEIQTFDVDLTADKVPLQFGW